MPAMLLKNYKSKAFTLIELLVCLSIAGALSIIALPKLSSYILKPNLKLSCRKLKSDLELLALKARKGHEDIRVLIKSNQYSAWDKEDNLISRKTLAKSLKIKNAPLTLKFFAGGISTPVSISLHDASASCSVIVSLRGRIRQL